MHRFPRFTLVLLIAAASIASAQDGAYRFQPDKKYKYLMESKVDVIQEVMGQSGSSSTEITLGSTLSLRETTAEGNLSLLCSIDNAIMIVESPQGMQTLGSGLAGKSVGFVMKPSGEVVDVDTTIAALQADGGAAMLQGFMEIMPYVDGTQLKPGGSWTYERKDTTGNDDRQMIRTVNAKFTVRGTKQVQNRSCLEITYEGEQEARGKGARGGQEFTISGESKEKGTVLFDAAEGLLIEATREENGEQTIAVSGGQSMKVNITMTQTGKIEFLPE